MNADEAVVAAAAAAAGGGLPRRRHVRTATWTDEVLDEVYDMRNLPRETAMKTKNLLHVLRTIRHCNRAADLDTSIALVIENTTELLGCDRATLFMVDELHSQLVIRKAVGMEDHVRIPWDQGLAGHVFHNGVTLNIPDVYQDNRFSGLIDAQSGYRTRSLLCAPVQDADNVTVAVIQAINKKAATADNSAASRDGCGDTENNSSSSGGACEAFVPFTMEDELLIDHLALQVGIILRNQIARDSIVRSHEQVVALLDIVRSLHSDLGLASLMFTITEKSPGLVDADRCTLYLADRQHGELWSIQGSIELRFPMTQGLAGHAAMHGEVVNIADAHEDSRFNKDFDLKSGYHTKSVLAMPIFDNSRSTELNTSLSPSASSSADANSADRHSRGNVIGVLQLINKKHGPSFSAEDEHLLKSFLDILGPILTNSQIFHVAQKKPVSEFAAASDIPMHAHKNKGGTNNETPRRIHSNGSRLGLTSGLAPSSSYAIAEEDEDGDDDDEELA